MRAAILALALASGCSARTFNRITFGAAQALIACDYGQTMPHALTGWRKPHTSEANLIMGPAPSATSLTVYNAGAAALLTATYHALPERWRAIPSVAVGLLQMVVVSGNAIVSPRPLCGVR